MPGWVMQVGLDVALATSQYPMARVVWPWLVRLSYPMSAAWPTRTATVFLCVAMAAVWAAVDLGYAPAWLRLPATVGLTAAVIFSSDDDDRPRRRRRLRSALKRARQFLARGVPAPEPARA